MKEIPLVNGKGVVLVDDEDYEYLSRFRWSCNSGGYAQANITVRMHRLLLGLSDKRDVDHVNANRLDNRKSNLRHCTRSQNIANTRYLSRNTTGYRGVYWHKGHGKFQAQLQINDKKLHLGYFVDPADAARAYDAAALEHFGEFAVLNFQKAIV